MTELAFQHTKHFKGHTFTLEVQFPLVKEYSSACKNSCMSSAALEERFKVWKKNPNDVTAL